MFRAAFLKERGDPFSKGADLELHCLLSWFGARVTPYQLHDETGQRIGVIGTVLKLVKRTGASHARMAHQ